MRQGCIAVCSVTKWTDGFQIMTFYVVSVSTTPSCAAQELPIAVGPVLSHVSRCQSEALPARVVKHWTRLITGRLRWRSFQMAKLQRPLCTAYETSLDCGRAAATLTSQNINDPTVYTDEVSLETTRCINTCTVASTKTLPLAFDIGKPPSHCTRGRFLFTEASGPRYQKSACSSFIHRFGCQACSFTTSPPSFFICAANSSPSAFEQHCPRACESVDSQLVKQHCCACRVWHAGGSSREKIVHSHVVMTDFCAKGRRFNTTCLQCSF